MKKVIKMMMMMLVASTFVLTSCSDDGKDDSIDSVKLTLNPAAASGTHFVYDTIKITLNGLGNADNKLKTLKITKAPEGKPTETLLNEKLSGTDKIYNFEYVTVLEDAGKITFTFTLDGEKDSETKTYVATIATTNAVDLLESRVLYDPRGGDNDVFTRLSAPYTLYSLDVSVDDWAANVDAAYFQGSSNGHTISSPSNLTDLKQIIGGFEASGHFAAGKPKVTGFYKVTDAERKIFLDVKADPNSDDRKLTLFANNKSFIDKASQLVPGDVILYKTKEGVLGLIKVNNVEPSGTNNPAEINFDMLIQVK